jgi:hypothetical protein
MSWPLAAGTIDRMQSVAFAVALLPGQAQEDRTAVIEAAASAHQQEGAPPCS